MLNRLGTEIFGKCSRISHATTTSKKLGFERQSFIHISANDVQPFFPSDLCPPRGYFYPIIHMFGFLSKNEANYSLRPVSNTFPLCFQLALRFSESEGRPINYLPLCASDETLRPLVRKFFQVHARILFSIITQILKVVAGIKRGIKVKILVTGGAGFVGSHVAEYYTRRGDEVTVLDNLLRWEVFKGNLGNPQYNWNYLKKYQNVKLMKGDIRNPEDLKKAAKGSDAIIHTAAQVAVTTSMKDPKLDFEVNAFGTLNVLEAARLNDSAVVYCSTNKVYGENVNTIPVAEEEKRYRFADEKYKKGIPEDFSIDRAWHTPYGCSKLAGDLYVQDYAHGYGLKTGVFRMSCIYGERQFGVEDQGWIAWFTIATMLGKPITIYGDGKQVRDVLYIADLVEVFDAFLKSYLKQGVFNIGGGPDNTLSLLELLDLLERLCGKKPTISFADWRPADQKVYISDISRAGEKLGWKPKVSPEEGVRKLVNWISDNLNLFNSI